MQINFKCQFRVAPNTGTFTFPNGTHICELEIDKQTGIVKIVDYTVVDDFGKVINPELLEGQVGGIVQGIGQALFEETIYDNDTGQLVTDLLWITLYLGLAIFLS